MTVYFRMEKLKYRALGWYDNAESVNTFNINAFAWAVEPIVASVFNAPWKHGPVKAGPFLNAHGLQALDLTMLEVYAVQNYVNVNLTPQYRRFNDGKVGWPTKEKIGYALEPMWRSFMAELRTRFIDDFSN